MKATTIIRLKSTLVQTHSTGNTWHLKANNNVVSVQNSFINDLHFAEQRSRLRHIWPAKPGLHLLVVRLHLIQADPFVDHFRASKEDHQIIIITCNYYNILSNPDVT